MKVMHQVLCFKPLWISILVLSWCTNFSMSSCHQKPHIIYILADDMGRNDVSYNGSPQIPTPNIDALASCGIILNNYYVLPSCTPSRAALMTGKYPIHVGLQHHVIGAGEPTALPLDFKILPQCLKDLDYSTHMIGKWNLGYYKKKYTPTYRGFDSFLGYWNGYIDYYDHTNYENSTCIGKVMWGMDFHKNEKLAPQYRGQYATRVFTERAVDIISNHDTSKPLFLYMANLACHVGNSYMPLQAPPEYVARFRYIKNLKRRTYAGVVAHLDDSIGDIFEALHRKGMLNNTILVFSSDNGGEDHAEKGGIASNWPLRSKKLELLEGGIRVPGFIWSPMLKLEEPRTSKQLMHISDWLPTLYCAAGGDVRDLGEIDGFNMWNHLKHNWESPRKEILLNIDNIWNTFGLRQGDWKLVSGISSLSDDGWYGTSGKEDVNVESMDEWVWKGGSVVKDILQQTNRWLPKTPDKWRANTTIHCNKGKKYVYATKCNPKASPCLFNIKNDPCEYQNLAELYPLIVEDMMIRIQEYNLTAVPSLSKPVDPHADPKCHGFAYVNWKDKEHISDCPWMPECE